MLSMESETKSVYGKLLSCEDFLLEVIFFAFSFHKDKTFFINATLSQKLLQACRVNFFD